MESSLLKLDDVVFRYIKDGKRNIIDHTSLEIKSKGFYVVMGSSGSGKSTLFSLSCGLYPENGGFLECGEINVFGKNITTMSPKERAKYITMMFQNPDLQFCMNTLFDELVFCLENIALEPSKIRERIDNAVNLFSLNNVLYQSLNTLSGGEKQMAMLCCLYAMQSEILILDEPFANIDSHSADKIITILKKLKAEGKTIIIVDHRLDKYLDLFDELIILGHGARMVCRNITRENLYSHKSIFEKEGLFFPSNGYIKKAQTKSNTTAIEFNNVVINKNKSDEVLLNLNNVSFPSGAITAFIGRSGAGKTTT